MFLYNTKKEIMQQQHEEDDKRNIVRIIIRDFHPDSPWKSSRCVVRVHKRTTIWRVKVNITEIKSGYKPLQFKLYWGGNMLDESKTVGDYGIVNNTVLNLSRERVVAIPEVCKISTSVVKPETANVQSTFSSKRDRKDFAHIDVDRLRKGVYVLKLEVEAMLFLLHAKKRIGGATRKMNNNKDPEISICLDIIRVLVEKHGVDPSRDSTDEDGRSAQTVFRDFTTVLFPERNQWPQSLRELAKILSIDLKRFKLKEETVHDMKRLADMVRAESCPSESHDTVESLMKRFETLGMKQEQCPRRRRLSHLGAD